MKRNGDKMKKIRHYAILDTKNMTLKEYFLTNNDFGKTYIEYSADIIPFGECKRYEKPFCFFIHKAEMFLKDEKNSLCEILENKTITEMIELFNNLF